MILPTAFIVILVHATAAEVSLINNGYSTVVVAIHENVSEDQSLLDAIKREFRAASSYLYRATKNRAYFKDITIVVPHTWPDRKEYGKAVSETFDNAVIQIEIASTDIAYVRRSPICGVTDGRMHVTPNRIKGLGTGFQSSPPSRMLVHEWAHLRWGVFDEHATKGRPKAYVANTGQVAGTTCSVELASTVWKTMYL
jgi:hypothetical protein